MVHAPSLSYSAALVLLELVPQALSHLDSHGDRAPGGKHIGTFPLGSNTSLTSAHQSSYFAHPGDGALILAHIGLMVTAWVFILPIGTLTL